MDHCPNRQMSYGFIPLNSFGKLLLLLQEEPRGSSLWKRLNRCFGVGAENPRFFIFLFFFGYHRAYVVKREVRQQQKIANV